MAEALEAAAATRKSANKSATDSIIELPVGAVPPPPPPASSLDIPITVGSSVHTAPPRPSTSTKKPSADDNSSALRRMLPHSRMRYFVMFMLLLAAGTVVGIVYVRRELAKQDDDAVVLTPVTIIDGAVATTDAPPSPTDAIVANATQLAATGKVDAAIDLLVDARKVYPDRAILPLTAGKLYFSKLWWADGIANFRAALKIDPKLRDDPAILDAVVRGFTTTPSFDNRLAQLLVELGAPAAPLLEQVEKTHANPGIRARAAAMRKRLR